MNTNSGTTIKRLAKIFFFIQLGIAGFIFIAFIALAQKYEIFAFLAFILSGIGVLFAWLTKIFMHGFGELIENSGTIASNFSQGKNVSSQLLASILTQTQNSISQRRQQIDSLYNQKQISEEQYRKAIETLYNERQQISH